MSEKKPESEPKKKSILDELRNFQIASLAIQHQAGIHEPSLLRSGSSLVQGLLKVPIDRSTLDLNSKTFRGPRVLDLVRESLELGKIRRLHSRKSSVWRSIDSMSSGEAK